MVLIESVKSVRLTLLAMTLWSSTMPFLVHHGFKTKEGFHSAKDEENNRNRDIFRTFKKELKLKYLQSTRHC